MLATRLRMTLVALVAAAVVVVATATPAAAHTISGPRPTNFASRVLSVTPAVPGLDVRVVDLGASVELTNHTGHDVVVLGYSNEPYLRVGRDGVFENLNSPSTYINRTTSGTQSPEAARADPTAPPAWHRVHGGSTARFHYHVTH
ncbi:MAG TPA: hypothetical protein VFR41_03300, partial [Acidimicrobiia bacterium]|nr:hypothetical protein [Acidimicrobiia bacterium]